MMNILVADDEASIVTFLKKVLSHEEYNVFSAESGKEALDVVSHTDIDLVLLDLLLPDMHGTEVLKRIKEMNPFIEIIMISGCGTIKDGVESIKAGAYDFIQKPFDISLLLAVVYRACTHKTMKTKFRALNTRYQHIKRLQEYQENIIHHMPVGFLTVDAEDRIVICNTMIDDLLEQKAEIAAQPKIHDIFKKIFSEYNRSLLEEKYKMLKQQGEKFDIILFNNMGKNDEYLHFRVIGAAFSNGTLFFINDITGEYNSKQQLIQQEKVAALGQFISGVTHGLGNNMANIISNASGVEEEVQVLGEDLESVIKRIKSLPAKKSGKEGSRDLISDLQTRGKRITDYSGRLLKQAHSMNENIRSLLKFSRQQPLVRVPTDINAVIEEAVSIIKSYSYKDIRFVSQLGFNLPRISVNPLQIKDLVIDLVLNGIQAMSHKGVITYATDYNKEREIVRIRIQDTGKGIDEKIRDKIFSAFFTTKENGTGLGLSNVKNTIKQHNGTIYFESEPGKGTIFFVELPAGA